MYDQRLQLLLSLEQRRRVEAEARRRDASVASIIREAIDAHLGTVDRAARLRAVEEIAAMRASPFLTAEELNRIVEEEREAQFKL
jgi:predicted DNA-binding protein